MPVCMYGVLTFGFLGGLVLTLIFQLLFKSLERINDSRKRIGNFLAYLSYLMFVVGIIFDWFIRPADCAGWYFWIIIITFAIFIIYFFYSLIVGKK